MTEWIIFSENLPSESIEWCLCWDIWCEDRRYNTCQPKELIVNIECMDGKFRTKLPIFNSICPEISSDEDQKAHWMPIPQDEWEDFPIDTFRSENVFGDEYLVQLHNGNYYVAHVSSWEWTPSYSSFKTGSLQAIKRYRKLPKPPEEP